MKTILLTRLSATVWCVAFLFLLACNSGDSSQKKMTDTTALNEQPKVEPALANNEVKSEAPDADNKTAQGYAFPRHTDNVAQSPIDIISSKADKAGKEQISFAFHSDVEAAENLGHTIELEFKQGSKCVVNGKDYTSAQFHFHTPSEHLVDGMTFPMEMHIVNVLPDSTDVKKKSYVVVGVLFKMGAENKFLKEFLDKVPAKEGDKITLQTGAVKLEDLFAQFAKNDINSYYTYKGSLTTPPFTESVQWIIMKHVVEASEDQIMILEKMEGNNARHVQAMNDRKVYTQ